MKMFKFIDFEKTKFKFKCIDFEKIKIKYKFKSINFEKTKIKFKNIDCEKIKFQVKKKNLWADFVSGFKFKKRIRSNPSQNPSGPRTWKEAKARRLWWCVR